MALAVHSFGKSKLRKKEKFQDGLRKFKVDLWVTLQEIDFLKYPSKQLAIASRSSAASILKVKIIPTTSAPTWM